MNNIKFLILTIAGAILLYPSKVLAHSPATERLVFLIYIVYPAIVMTVIAGIIIGLIIKYKTYKPNKRFLATVAFKLILSVLCLAFLIYIVIMSLLGAFLGF